MAVLSRLRAVGPVESCPDRAGGVVAVDAPVGSEGADDVEPVMPRHLAAFAEPDPGALAFPGAKGGPLRRANFNRSAAWPQAVAAIGAPGLHFHDLRHAGTRSRQPVAQAYAT
jgi:integrase